MMVKSGSALGMSALILYLAYHAMSGQQGLANWGDMQDSLESLNDRQKHMIALRDELQEKVDRLSPESLDLDFIEELARTQLNYAYPDDVLFSLYSVEENTPSG